MALGQTGMWKKKQTAKWGGTCIGKGESGNYPQVWLGFVFLCFGPLPAFPSGLLKTLYSSVGLKKILGTQYGRQDNWQGKPWGDWVCDAQSLEAPSPDTFLVCALQLFASPKELPTHPFVWALQDILKSVLNFNNLGLKKTNNPQCFWLWLVDFPHTAGSNWDSDNIWSCCSSRASLEFKEQDLEHW